MKKYKDFRNYIEENFLDAIKKSWIHLFSVIRIRLKMILSMKLHLLPLMIMWFAV